jgi:hypothetical protein
MSPFGYFPAMNLLSIYVQFLNFKIYVVVDNSTNLKDKYISAANSHNIKIHNNINNHASGFDLFLPSQDQSGNELENTIKFYGPNREYNSPVNQIDYKIICSAQIYTDSGKVYNTGYHIHPTSNLSTTQLRLANATGIIHAGHRENITCMFDVVNINTTEENYLDYDYLAEEYDRLVQICAPSLLPMHVEIVNNLNDLGIVKIIE